MESVDPSKKHFYISLVKSGLRLFGCYALFQAGMIMHEDGNPSGVIVITAVAFAVAEVLGILEEL
mgnify:CR=1 FL=1|jgi:hypothetical protein|tara:strand:- start:287 stop:481 length:195 start_codon:yes stop_codon:yes gene_type:complete